MDVYEFERYLKKVLNPENKKFKDGCANGLQIDCENTEIKKIVFGVSASLELFKKAKELGADAIIVHHGIGFSDKHIINGIPSKILQKRMNFLYSNKISLFGFHYLLDSHINLGNNGYVLNKLNVDKIEEFGVLDGCNWAYSGVFNDGKSLDLIKEKLNNLYLDNFKIYEFGPKIIKKISVVSGGGSFLISQAVESGADLFVTGDIKEGNINLAREYGINLGWGGHYITERIGVLALMEKVKSDSKIDCEFVEVIDYI